MKAFITLGFVLFVVVFSQAASAASPVEFWGCKLNDGKELSDLMDWAEEWGELVDDLPDDGYNAWVMTPMYSSNMTDLDFLWVGAWPDYTRMGSGMDGFFNGDEGSAMFARFIEISHCKVHDLFSSTQVRENTGE